jgi:Uma2 family endonuclease
MSATLTAQTTGHEQSLVLPAVTWRQYETLLQAFPEQAGLRIYFLDGRLTLLSPSYRHDLFAEYCADIVKAVARGLGVVLEQAGQTTYRREENAGGVEGDKPFYLGEHAERMIGATEIDLTTQPPPDLVIEVEFTHSAGDAVAVWGRLGVPEVWRLDVKRWALTFGVRQPDGTYAPAPRSAGLAPLEPNDVLEQLRLAEQLGFSRWSAQLDGWVRGVILPRRGG